jgi:hypothetical protein
MGEREFMAIGKRVGVAFEIVAIPSNPQASRLKGRSVIF